MVPPKAIIYTRFSPRPDANDSDSCETQERICRDYAQLKGFEVVSVHADPDRSGADEFREELWAAINEIKKGCVLLVYKRDRLARNVYLAESINRAVAKRQGRIVAVTGDVEGDTPETQLIRQVVAAMAEYERKLISKRTSDAMKAKQRAGKRVSRYAPYGWRFDADGVTLIEDPAEQEVRREILRLHAQGVGYFSIAKRASEMRKARNGKDFAISVIYQICKRG